MRQSGILAAGLRALDHLSGHRGPRNARLRASGLPVALGQLDLKTVQSNIASSMDDGAPDAATVVARAQEMDVWSGFGRRTVRAAPTNVSRADCELAADRLARVLE
jgi:hypothetical protein